MKQNLICSVDDEDTLLEFYDKGFMIFENLNENQIEILIEKLSDIGYGEKNSMLVYSVSGDVMNDFMGLTDNNRYDENLFSIIVPDFYNPYFKLQHGGRYIDDVFDIKVITQREINMNNFISNVDLKKLFEG